MRAVLISLILLIPMWNTAHACERCGPRGYNGGPQVGQQLLFRSANGGAFQPRTLTVTTTTGTQSTSLPAAVNSARDDNRIDLSGTQIVGGLFEPTLSTDQAHAGIRIGPVFQSSSGGLVVDATNHRGDLTGLPITLTTNLPGRGAVSYPLGLQQWHTGPAETQGTEIGDAFLLDGRMVIASRGGEPAYPSIGAFLESIFN